MKKSLLTSALLIAAFFLPFLSNAQMMPQLPVDKDVRIGTLPNGLTYYIRHNDYPKGQADFYIAQKVGSILEEDNQRGLAHFLEHMCFNGTTHFPGKNLINWLESVGVKFGANLNAYTAVDMTVYNIDNVPVAREGVQDSCLLILHDWANDLLLLPEEIDAERAVIHEEWRRSNVGQMRILEKLLPVMYPGDRYGYRLPIGTMEVVDNFPHQALRDYYEKWYRPDQQGIIVVGDIDVNRIESKIKEMFSDIEMPENPAERVYFPVSDTKGTIYAIGHDPEQKNALVSLMFKEDAFPDSLKNTQAYYITSYVQNMIEMMLNTRLNDISSKPDAPFGSASVSFGDFFLAKTKEALSVDVLAKDGNLPPAIAAAYRELLRAVRGGFTQSEYDRAKSELLSRWEKSYNNRRKTENNTYVQEYVQNFLNSKPIPGIEVVWPMMQQLAAMIPLQLINQASAQLAGSDNRVLLALLPEKEGATYPTDNDFAQALAAVDGETIEPFVDEVKSEPLIETRPVAGKIVSEKHNAMWDATEWTLSNGATVIVKPTAFKDDEIVFAAVANGGYAPKFGDSYANSIIFMPYALSQYGLGTYTNSDLQKYLSGKQCGIRMNWSNNSRQISGNTTPKDMPTLMELVYMAFTNVNFTADEFEALQKTYSGAFHNQEKDPSYIFGAKVLESLYASPCMRAVSVAAIEGASREQTIEISRAMTANAADFTFVFVGAVDPESLKPMVEEYIASLPADKATASRAMAAPQPAFALKGGYGIDTYKAAMQTPQTQMMILDWGTDKYTMRAQQLSSVTGQILSKRLNDIVREEMGAVYSIGASGAMDRIDSEVVFQTGSPMKPEMKDEVLKAIRGQFEDMKTNVSKEELAKVIEYMVKSYTEAKEKNGPWLSAIIGYTINGVDTFNGNIESVTSITTDDVCKFMAKILDQNNYRVVLLEPED
ncbi:MAG: insulinase family protein [Muribaculaceae bacterium]|nr:insulinase family protein [Muribaculaceae bacterium]